MTIHMSYDLSFFVISEETHIKGRFLMQIMYEFHCVSVEATKRFVF